MFIKFKYFGGGVHGVQLRVPIFPIQFVLLHPLRRLVAGSHHAIAYTGAGVSTGPGALLPTVMLHKRTPANGSRPPSSHPQPNAHPRPSPPNACAGTRRVRREQLAARYGRFQPGVAPVAAAHAYAHGPRGAAPSEGGPSLTISNKLPRHDPRDSIRNDPPTKRSSHRSCIPTP